MKLRLQITLLLLLGSFQVQSQADSSRIVKVLSFNILHGETTKGDFDLEVLANLIRKAQPDFVALQEVDFQTRRAKQYDLATELGWRTKMAPLFGRAMPFDSGEYGEGVLSKFTFLQSRTVALPALPGHEPRAALEIVTVLPSMDTITFVGTHFAHEEEASRVLQAKMINQVFAHNSYPTILAGDLNAEPGSETINLLEEKWGSAYNKENPQPTFSSDDPQIKIDYVMFYPKHRWKVLDRTVIQDSIASDHCGYLVTLELQEATQPMNTERLREEEAVKATLTSMWEAIENEDIETYAAYIHPDFTQFGESDSVLRKGKAAEVEATRAWIRNSSGIHTEMEEPMVEVRGNTAWIVYYWRDRGMTNGKPFASRGKSTRIFVKEKGKWLCIHGHYTLLD